MPNRPRYSAVQFGLVLALFVVAVFGSAVVVVLYVKNADERERKRTDYALCVQSRINRDAIRAAITAGDPTLLIPGQYGYEYARTHPEEAETQHQAIVAGKDGAFKQFPKIECPPFEGQK